MGLRKNLVIVASAVGLIAGAAGVARAQTPIDQVLNPRTDIGTWEGPFVEPSPDPAHPTTPNDPSTWCRPQTESEPDGSSQPAGAADSVTGGKNLDCTPTAGSMAILGDNDVVYWDALEDMEEVETSVATEFGAVSVNDQTRRMTRENGVWNWIKPDPDNNDGGASEPPMSTFNASGETYNDGALFCAALTFLPDGRVLAVGGTSYYNDPSVPGTKYGVAELQGLKSARIFDPRTNLWSSAGQMDWGRWYPTSVPLSDGTVFVASGVTKLMKPLYSDGRSPEDNGRNVVQTETYTPDPNGGPGSWSPNIGGDRSLPLFPRLHLIPGGRVYFNAAGQVFNPMGYAYDEVGWNFGAFYDPNSKTWAQGDIPGIGTPAPGFRGSTFSVMLPLEPNPDDNGRYDSASFLTAGGIIGTTPGTYFAVPDSRIDTVGRTGTKVTSEMTSPMNQPRWYGTGVLTPTGEVIAFSGATADEVDGPGTAIPITVPELFDPTTKTWRELAPASQKRTYHNTAALLPDGRILVGGHAPIGTLYGPPKTLVPGVTSPQESRNPTFEIYSPPYLDRGPRPAIVSTHVLPTDTGHVLEISLDPSSNQDVSSVMLMRRTAITHLVDGGQRGVQLNFTRDGSSIRATMPDDPTVLPPGPYLVFVNANGNGGPTPSEAAELMLDQTGNADAQPPRAGGSSTNATVNRDVARAGGVPVDAELAFHEIAEINGHRHSMPSPASSRVPWPAWPALVAVMASALWAGRVRRRDRTVITQ